MVWKEFRASGDSAEDAAADLFSREISLYSHIRSHPGSSRIVSYYGSFQQSDRRVIVIEYCNGGDLANFLETHPSIEQPLHRWHFWKGFLDLLQGLDAISTLHPIQTSGESPRRFELRGYGS